MDSPEPAFSHVTNTRPPHRRWRIIGVAESTGDPGVRSVEIFQGPDFGEPNLTLTPEEVPQFVAGLIAAVMPGDMTAESTDVAAEQL